MVPKYDSQNARDFDQPITEISLGKPGDIFFVEIDNENHPPECVLRQIVHYVRITGVG